MAAKWTRRRTAAVAAVVVLIAAVGVTLRIGSDRDRCDAIDSAAGRAGTVAPAPVAPSQQPSTRGPRRRARAAAEQQPSAPPADANCAVRVRVTSKTDGTPVAGAWVMVDDAGDTWPEATTDAAGGASFPHVTPGEGLVIARARGFLEGSVDVTARPDAETPVELLLVPGAVVEVSVLDAVTDAPVADAVVELWSETGLGDDSALTEADGRAVGLVSPDAPMIVGVEAKGYQRAEEPVRSGPLGGPPVPLVVRLRRAATLTGIVRTPDGDFADADVNVRREDAAAVERRTTTGERGAYALDGLVLGRAYLVTATDRGWSESEPVRVVATPERHAMRADLVLRPATTVVVSTVDDDGEPLGDVSVEVESADGNYGGSSVQSGQRVDVDPGACVVRARSGGRVSASAERNLAAGETWEVTLTLSVGATITGTVVDANGTPLDDIRVEVLPPQGEAACLDTTDEEGRFVLRALAPGPHDVRVEGGGDFETVVVPSVTAPSGGLRVVLPRRGRLRMRIEREDDVGGVVEIAGTGTDGRRIVVQHAIGEHGGVDVAWPEDAESAIVVSAPGFAPTTRTARVPQGGETDLGAVRLVRGVGVTGKLRFAAGDAAVRVPLRASQRAAPGRIVAATTEDDGSFRLAGLLPGRVVIEALPEDWPGATYDVEVGSGKPLDLALPALGVVWVRVTVPDGGPEAGVEVRALGPDGWALSPASWVMDTTDELGGAILRLPPGRARIDVGGRVQTEAEVRPDDLTVVRVELP